MTAGLLAGVARVVITPPVGIHLTGFAGRPPSTGVHDDLTATALVLAEGGAGDAGEAQGAQGAAGDARRRVALLALDLLGVQGESLVPAIKDRLHEVTGIPPERVFLNCSHTHYGPVLAPAREGGEDAIAERYRSTLPDYLAGVVATAGEALRPVTLAAARGAVRVGINRRERRPDGRIILGQNPEGTLDSEVLVWRFDAADGPEVEPGAPLGWPRRAGEPVAVVVNYACHGVSLGSRVRQVSADFPGVTRDVVEQLVGGKALYLQGAAGNINPALMGSDWDHPRRLGHALGAEAAKAALTAQPVSAVPLRVARETLELPALIPESVEAGRERVALLEAEQARLEQRGSDAGAGARWWAAQRLERARQGLAALETGQPLPPVTGEVAALRLGEAAVVTCPGELFCEIGMAIKQASPFPWTAMAAYTDGTVGYLPTRAAYPEGGYEVDSACRVNPEAGEMVEAAGLRLLRSLS
jgi:neutral ceramidase